LNLDRTAVRIAKDLKQVVFIGAYAAIQHGVARSTRDIDIALATPKTNEEFEKLGYNTYQERGKKVIRTRNGIKIDVYTKDVSGIPVRKIFASALTVRKADSQIKVMCLEALLLAKMRAGRPQDNDDIRQLCRLRGKAIRWDLIESLARGLEAIRLRQYVSAFS
jgi:predicted nucleotidyltransferase